MNDFRSGWRPSQTFQEVQIEGWKKWRKDRKRWRKRDHGKGGASVLQSCEEVGFEWEIKNGRGVCNIQYQHWPVSWPQMRFILFSMKNWTLSLKTQATTVYHSQMSRPRLWIQCWVSASLYLCSVGVIKVCFTILLLLHAVKLNNLSLLLSYLLFVCSMDVRLYRQPEERGLR